MTDVHHRVLQYVSPDAIRLNPKNPRKHSRSQIQAIVRSIETFGFNAPILVDRDMQIVAGHGRREAAKLLGLSKIPIICLADLNEAQAKAYMLADNKLTDLSTWDDQLLASTFEDLSNLAREFDLETTGFQTSEIDLCIQSLDEDVDQIDDVTPSPGPAVSRVGDRWALGPHLLICGSALDPGTYAGIDNQAVSAVFTDPPWNVPIQGHVSGLGKIKHREFVQASGEMSADQFTEFLTKALALAQSRCRKGAVMFVCLDWRHLSEILAVARNLGLDLINLCVWSKTNAGMGSLYRSQHELVFVFRNGAAGHQNNVQLGRHGRNRTNIWTYPGANVPTKRERPLAYHPTPKPVRLVADAILDCTSKGDCILDPFLGSGTSILAAERTGRRAIGIELDPLYVDTAILRWQKLTGHMAFDRSGKAFLEIASERTI